MDAQTQTQTQAQTHAQADAPARALPGEKRREFAAGWRVLLAGLAGAMFGISALPFYTLGLFVKPLGEAFGWPPGEVQLGFTAQMLGIVAAAWAWRLATDRWGARRIAIVSQLGLGLGLPGVAFVDSLVRWYAARAMAALLHAPPRLGKRIIGIGLGPFGVHVLTEDGERFTAPHASRPCRCQRWRRSSSIRRRCLPCRR